LVRWKGYTAKVDTWEGREDLGNAKELVQEFEREYGKVAEVLQPNNSGCNLSLKA